MSDEKKNPESESPLSMEMSAALVKLCLALSMDFEDLKDRVQKLEEQAFQSGNSAAAKETPVAGEASHGKM